MAAPSQIPDEIQEYLLWHEVVHHLLPGQGHDAEFRRLEALWPDSERHDQFLYTLDERFDLTADTGGQRTDDLSRSSERPPTAS